MNWILHMLGRGTLGREVCCGEAALASPARSARRLADGPPSTHPPSTHLLAAARRAEAGHQPRKALRLYRRIINRSAAPDWVHQRAAVLSLLTGNIVEALGYWDLQREPAPDAPLIRAALLARIGRCHEARTQFCTAIGRWLDPYSKEWEKEMVVINNTETPALPPADDAITRLIDRGNSCLHQGDYTRASVIFDEAMGLVDLLMAAHGAWILAEQPDEAPQPGQPALSNQLTEALIGLAHLSDLLLRCQARARLSLTVADALRKRSMREDLAAWATGCREIERLLDVEQERLLSLVARRPNQAETHYRLALVASARHNTALAQEHFRAVLAIEPHHAESAVRLAATLAEQGNLNEARAILLRMDRIELPDLWRYYQLAVAAGDEKRFESVVQQLEQSTDAPREVRANLAFAFGEMGATDRQLETGAYANANCPA